MAQAGFILSDEGRTISAVNDSTTTAITAGDPVYFTTNNDVVTATAASVRAAYAMGDIKVKSIVGNTAITGYLTPAGIALTDCDASTSTVDKVVTVALSGVFMHPVTVDTEAGDEVQFSAYSASCALAKYTGSAGLAVGRALTGGSAAGKYIIWKLNI